ncbi:MAG: segregation/condensation protein A [Verrucomicrobiota bacterium]
MSELTPNELRVQLPTFEGPLDLLLYLVKQEEVDIYNIPIERVTQQYLKYIELMQQLDLEVAGEFLVVAATLVYIKSRTLIPKSDQAPLLEDEEEMQDPRWELIRQLVEYKKFKEAAAHLDKRLDYRDKIFLKGHYQWTDTAALTPRKGSVGALELMDALNRVLSKLKQQPDAGKFFDEKFTVGEKMDFIRKLVTFQDETPFSQLFAEAASRYEVVVTFLAILELLKQCEISVHQEGEFSEIMVRPRDPSAPVRQEEEGNSDAAFAEQQASAAAARQQARLEEGEEADIPDELEPEEEVSESESAESPASDEEKDETV